MANGGIEFTPSVGPISPGINRGIPGGVPPMPVAPPGPDAKAALSAMDQLGPKANANPTEGLAKVDEALDLAHQLILQSLPQATSWNHDLAAKLHQVAKSILAAKEQMRTEVETFAAPPGMGMEAAGMPSGGPISAQGGPMGSPSPIMR